MANFHIFFLLFVSRNVDKDSNFEFLFAFSINTKLVNSHDKLELNLLKWSLILRFVGSLLSRICIFVSLLKSRTHGYCCLVVLPLCFLFTLYTMICSFSCKLGSPSWTSFRWLCWDFEDYMKQKWWVRLEGLSGKSAAALSISIRLHFTS